MRGYTSHARFYRDSIKDRVRPKDNDASKLPGVILFASTIVVFPLAYSLDWQMGIGWLGSALGALAIAAILAVGACMMVRR